MKIDASNFVLEATLSKIGEDKKFHPIAFYFKKFLVVEINCIIHDKELLAIIESFQEWHHLLEGAIHPITVYANCKILEYFT